MMRREPASCCEHAWPRMCRERAQEPSDDEESFHRKEHKRLKKDIARLDPISLGGLACLQATQRAPT